MNNMDYVLAKKCAKEMATSYNFSDKEQQVGKWIDGSPLYQTTIHYYIIPTGREITVSHNIPEVGLVVDFYGFALNGNKGTVAIPTQRDDLEVSVYNVNSKNFTYYCKGENFTDIYLTLVYVKQ